MELNHFAQEKLQLANNANDVAGLDTLRQAAQSGDKQALQKAAEQFEAIFVRMMLKSMRKAQDVLADKDSPMNSEYMKFYRDMHDQQLASDLASSKGMGLADLIVQQLSPEAAGFIPSSVIRNGANLPESNMGNKTEQVTPVKAPAFDSPQAFIEHLKPVVEPVAEELGLSAEALLAQAALETGWGQQMIMDKQGNSANNLFGIKAGRDWQGNSAAVPTMEFKQGIASRKQAHFRAYESLEASVKDYGKFIQQDRYKDALSSVGEPEQYFAKLQQAGYATDPNYAEKVLSIMQRLGE